MTRGTVVTVGSFDGVHLGHRAVLEEIARRGAASGRRSMLVTFDPHPLDVVNPAAAPQMLTVGDERYEALAETPVDSLLVLRFDPRLAAMDPGTFVREVLVRRCAMAQLVIGHDHGFGRGRSGDVETLSGLGRTLEFDVDVVGAVDVSGQPVSSSRIRRAVAGGDLVAAARLLGRPYSVGGTVEAGERRGRTIGFPTVNLPGVSPRKLLPPDGVYAVRVETGVGVFGGMMNQGSKPTFGEMRRVLEAHLFDFDGDLYGRRIRVEWVERIRDIRRFASIDDLKAQLARDRAQAEAMLAAVRIP